MRHNVTDPRGLHHKSEITLETNFADDAAQTTLPNSEQITGIVCHHAQATESEEQSPVMMQHKESGIVAHLQR